ncbi:hypothetical protein O3P69_019076 [Scylla paramamosain]|uniref:Uncharacterized protein n=1 Tax=Scylla paramamosain TaxID=85552 RepID=A0AAW0T9E1_SCYPA
MKEQAWNAVTADAKVHSSSFSITRVISFGAITGLLIRMVRTYKKKPGVKRLQYTQGAVATALVDLQGDRTDLEICKMCEIWHSQGNSAEQV